MVHAQLVVLGMAAGAATTASGIGWGVVTMPVLLGLLRFEPTVAVSMTVVAGFAYPLSMFLVRSVFGDLPIGATVALALGGFIGGVFGALLLPLIPALLLKRVIALATIVLGVIALVRT